MTSHLDNTNQQKILESKDTVGRNIVNVETIGTENETSLSQEATQLDQLSTPNSSRWRTFSILNLSVLTTTVACGLATYDAYKSKSKFKAAAIRQADNNERALTSIMPYDSVKAQIDNYFSAAESPINFSKERRGNILGTFIHSAHQTQSERYYQNFKFLAVKYALNKESSSGEDKETDIHSLMIPDIVHLLREADISIDDLTVLNKSASQSYESLITERCYDEMIKTMKNLSEIDRLTPDHLNSSYTFEFHHHMVMGAHLCEGARVLGELSKTGTTFKAPYKDVSYRYLKKLTELSERAVSDSYVSMPSLIHSGIFAEHFIESAEKYRDSDTSYARYPSLSLKRGLEEYRKRYTKRLHRDLSQSLFEVKRLIQQDHLNKDAPKELQNSVFKSIDDIRKDIEKLENASLPEKEILKVYGSTYKKLGKILQAATSIVDDINVDFQMRDNSLISACTDLRNRFNRYAKYAEIAEVKLRSWKELYQEIKY